MLRLRTTHPALATGRYEAPRVDGRTLSFRRVDADERIVVVLNYASVDGAASLAGLPANARLQRLYPAADSGEIGPADAQGRLGVPAAPLSVQVFRVSR